MALGAQQRSIISELDCCGILNIMHTMTINAGRHVEVAKLGQGVAMHAILIGVIDRAVTLGAGLRNVQSGGD